ncbi:MAG: hypothetical protein ISS70_26240 [Phycisphaerae bacterium]|nr:hypothetical protein [Phycisphaerae bacterium]
MARDILASVILLVILSNVTWGGQNLSNEHFEVRLSERGLESLKRVNDRDDVEFIASGKSIGLSRIKYSVAGGSTMVLEAIDCNWQKELGSGQEGYVSDIGRSDHLSAKSRIALDGDKLAWRIALENVSSQPLEVLDIALPLPMNTVYEKGASTHEHFTQRLFRHSHIAGGGSFLFWLPVGGEGSSLLMLCDSRTHLEYFAEASSSYARGGANYEVYIHSKGEGSNGQGGTWRQKHTSLKLGAGEKKVYGFHLLWADGYDDIRHKLFENDGFDIRVAPGMVVPSDQTVRFSLGTTNRIREIIPEFPKQTTVRYLGETAKDTHLYEAGFSRLGENMLMVRYGNGRSMPMEFFVTEPLETVIKKRASFIANSQQHRNPSKWYNGLFSLWDMRRKPGENLLGPDNLGGQHMYAVAGSDDPSSGKVVFLSEKNLVYPNAKEIAAIEYYLESFVWGKLQRTDKESPYPYGIYGSDNWKENREATRDPIEEGISRPGQGGSQCRMWRTFDYTHYILLYYNMYRIAKQNPEMTSYLKAEEYLERAFGTAKAFFEVPYSIRMEGGWAFTGWTDWAYKIGNFHEKYLLPLIDALDSEGHVKRAEFLRGEWEKKVKFFIFDDEYPWVSEMPVDSTAYESTYAIAKYAMTHKLKPDRHLWKDKNTGNWYSHPQIDPAIGQRFMKRQLLANLACRGWLETSYYYLGSDFRGMGSAGYCMSYMSQMGGWAVLDYALDFADNPAEYLRLGYASILSSWGLVNCGDQASNYGYWYSGKLHDGAVGWGFCPQRVGQEWNRGCWDKEAGGVLRGIWPVCGEIDHGLTAGVEAACTVVMDDPILGLLAYGGSLTIEGDKVSVICRDGVRQHLHYINDGMKLSISLGRDGFAKDEPIVFTDEAKTIKFAMENRGSKTHSTEMKLQGLPRGSYSVLANGRLIQRVGVSNGKRVILKVPVPTGGETMAVEISRK